MLFFFFPVGVARRIASGQWVSVGLLIACVAVFLIQNLLLPLLAGPDAARAIFHVFALHTDFRPPWALLTHLFLHAGLMHLAFNMLYLYLVGRVLEDRIGSPATLLLFLVGGLIAALLHTLIFRQTADLDIPLVGASGAISALMGASVVLMPWVEFRIFYFFWFLFIFRSGIFLCPAFLFLLLYYFLTNLFSGVLDLGRDSAGSNVAYWAHIGGFATGFLWAGMQFGYSAFGKSEHEADQDFEKQREQGRMGWFRGWQKSDSGLRAREERHPPGSGVDFPPLPRGRKSTVTAAILKRLIATRDAGGAWRAYREKIHESPGYALPPREQQAMLELFLREQMPEASLEAGHNLVRAYGAAAQSRKALLEAARMAGENESLALRARQFLKDYLQEQISEEDRVVLRRLLLRLQPEDPATTTGDFEPYHPGDSRPLPDKAQPQNPGDSIPPITLEADPATPEHAPAPHMQSKPPSAWDAPIPHAPVAEQHQHITNAPLLEESGNPPAEDFVHPEASCCLILRPRREIDFQALILNLAEAQRQEPRAVAEQLRARQGILIENLPHARGLEIQKQLHDAGLAVRLIQNRPEYDFSACHDVARLLVRGDRWVARDPDGAALDIDPNRVRLITAGAVQLVPGSPARRILIDIFHVQPTLRLRIDPRQLHPDRCIGLHGFPLPPESDADPGTLREMARQLLEAAPNARPTYALRQWLRASGEAAAAPRSFASPALFDNYNRWHALCLLAPAAR